MISVNGCKKLVCYFRRDRPWMLICLTVRGAAFALAVRSWAALGATVAARVIPWLFCSFTVIAVCTGVKCSRWFSPMFLHLQVKLYVFQSHPHKPHQQKYPSCTFSLLCIYLPCDVFLEAFFAESCSPSLSSLLLSFRSSSNILTPSAMNSNLQLSQNLTIYFSILITVIWK